MPNHVCENFFDNGAYSVQQLEAVREDAGASARERDLALAALARRRPLTPEEAREYGEAKRRKKAGQAAAKEKLREEEQERAKRAAAELLASVLADPAAAAAMDVRWAAKQPGLTKPQLKALATQVRIYNKADRERAVAAKLAAAARELAAKEAHEQVLRDAVGAPPVKRLEMLCFGKDSIKVVDGVPAGTRWIDAENIACVAKRMGIPHARALYRFTKYRGKLSPQCRGVVVAVEDADRMSAEVRIVLAIRACRLCKHKGFATGFGGRRADCLCVREAKAQQKIGT